MQKSGIAVVGTVLVDNLYGISAYPAAGELTKILSVDLSVGGMVPNDGVDIKKIAPEIPVFAVGKIGADDRGRYATNFLKTQGVDVTYLKESEGEATSFTDVMSVIGGQRTFFTFAGANATFGFDDVPWDSLDVKMLHLGYFLLLDKVDGGDGLKILQEAKRRGISTSIDLVSENSDRYACVIPCLPYVDNLILNETEAGKICGVAPTEDNLVEIAKKLFLMGVNERVIIHTPETAVCVTASGATELSSYVLPKGYVKGTTGAGDAFCSGALVAIYEGCSETEILSLAQMAAVASLTEADATSGVKEKTLLQEAVKGFKRR